MARDPNRGLPGVVSRFATASCSNLHAIGRKQEKTMQISHHAAQRMSQRGISRRLVDFALRHGRIEGDKRVLDRNESRRLIDDLEEELRLAKRVMDKGGIVVVDQSDTLVTAYNLGVPVNANANAANANAANGGRRHV
jgi:hypothetical protein